jgi:hypothetical protein
MLRVLDLGAAPPRPRHSLPNATDPTDEREPSLEPSGWLARGPANRTSARLARTDLGQSQLGALQLTLELL